MGINFAQNWPVYILLAAVVIFFIAVIINGNKQEKINKESLGKNKAQGSK